MELQNPFVTSNYIAPGYFCDRNQELSDLISAIDNGSNVTLFAARRIGKTGLIHHLFHHLPEKKYLKVFIDVYGTTNIEGFTNVFITALSRALEQLNSQSKIKSLTDTLGRLRPKITVDPLTYLPSVELGVQSSNEAKETISSMLNLAMETKKQIVIALDEFQQISTYPEIGFEATMRTIVQAFPQIRFIFLGSQKHLLLSMFGDRARPFYRSTMMMKLFKLEPTIYSQFILDKFKKAKRSISQEAIDYIFEKTQLQTYYVQFWLSYLYQQGIIKIEKDMVIKAFTTLLLQEEPQYFQLRNILPDNQWKVLVAIALAGQVDTPTGKAFLSKYQLGAASSVRQAINRLVELNLVLKEYYDIKEKPIWSLDDAFLREWVVWRYS